ncbi:MAG: molecular chaperone Tir [Oscillatoria sp. SIO1A7]|nr:molecular chaperone Tir [Oscillatoria sp. SIO1A7]
MPRSLKVRQDYISTVKSSLLRNGFPSQKILAEDLGISQSTVSNFLNGRPVDYINFQEICRVLAQEWRDVADLGNGPVVGQEREVKATISISDRSDSPALAQELQQALRFAGHIAAIANPTSTTEHLHRCDYLLLLLSARSLSSEIPIEEIKSAKELHHFTPQKPAILPIWIGAIAGKKGRPLLSFELIRYLEKIQLWQWRNPANTAIIISELLEIIRESRTALPGDRELAVNWSDILTQTETEDRPQTNQLEKLDSQLCFPNSQLNARQEIAIFSAPLPVASPGLPEGQVELASHFYIERPPIEKRCYETIGQPGALIRIKAPRQMGKTSLLARILHSAENQGSRTVALSFQLANQRVFDSSERFLQWFCASISLELELLDAAQLAKYAQLGDIIGSNQSCKAYLEQYLLPAVAAPLTLGLDEVDRVFESPEVADDFFGLLRSLHEESKRRDIWKNFRLVVVHSTEVYIPLDVNKSPFNVGLPIELPEFTPKQVQELAARYGLAWNSEEVEKLMNLLGGHPYLVRLAMYHIACQDVTLAQLVEEAPTEAGLYGDHLRRHLWNLEKYPELMEAMEATVASSEPVRLPSALGFKLSSMGLVKLEGNYCRPRCRLYRQYFGDRFSQN